MNITIPTSAPDAPITPFWTKCVGSCHAATALREDWRRQLKKCHDELGFEYVRFHGILNDDMSVCLRSDDGTIEYSFFNIDSIIDFLLSIGMKPFIELSFMPEALASGSKTVFHYKGNITPPKSYDEWSKLIYALAIHLVERYGICEVRKWFFEVWNEPNLDMFWAGTMQDYFLLYQSAALAIKKIDRELLVGGPATAIDAWIPDLKDFCDKHHVPLDFISTHHYPTDAAFGLGLNMEEHMARSERGVLTARLRKALVEADPFPLYYTEWNNSPSPRDTYHDDPYCATFLVKTITDHMKSLNGKLPACYSFWTFSDIFEECGLSSLPFHGGFGLLNIHGIPKPSYRAFQMLSHLRGNKLNACVEKASPTVDCFSCRDRQNIIILLTNYQVPLSPVNEEQIHIRLKGCKRVRSAALKRIDENHANPKKAWMDMGSSMSLNSEQIQDLVKASEPVEECIEMTFDGDETVMEFVISSQSVVEIALIVED